jgi:tRNA threonylcarbamoyladenosine biosynthesis protein TsaE
MKKQPKVINSKSLSEMSKFAKGFLSNIVPANDHATIYGLSGDLGSGKTAFVKEVAHHLGLNKENITSPTFVIEKIYKLSSFAARHSSFKRLIHIDAYRLEDPKELLNLGWEEISSNRENLIMIEWPEIVAEILPEHTRTIYFEFVNETTRKIRMKNKE